MIETNEAAHDVMMPSAPDPAHDWLRRLVGEWTYEITPLLPGHESERATGTERIRPIGGFWIVAEAQGQVPGGGQATSIMSLGYEPWTKRFTGTWIGSMMTHLWVYDGSLDPTERVLTLSCEGPSFEVEGKMTRYRDVIEIEGADLRTLTAHVLGEDGQWHQMVRTTYRRTA